MRLLNISLRSFLRYSLILVVVSIPTSFITIRLLLNEEVDESLALHREEFLQHIKSFHYLEDLETDLKVFDQLTFDISIKPSATLLKLDSLRNISHFDSMEMEDKPYRELISGVMIKSNPYVLTIRQSLVESNDLAFAIGMVQSILILFLILGFVLINRKLSGKLWAPFYATLNNLKQFQIDKSQSFVFETTRVDEFNDLNNAIQDLTEKSKAIYRQQKEFTENASHEMQTPLAIMQSKLDVLMQSPDLTESQAVIIQDMSATSLRMARLNRNLLLLSKLDNDQFNETEPVDISIIISLIATNLKPLADVQGITIEQNLIAHQLTGNKTLIEILVSNLLSNALRHNQPNGTVVISITQQQLVVSNTGSILTVPIHKLFERFNKEGSHPQSVGLGLAIVKKICDTCGYSITYNFTNTIHQFSVSF